MIDDWTAVLKDIEFNETTKIALINGITLSIEMAYDYGFQDGRYPKSDLVA